jgi:ubiquitin-like-conjugating enzyme ATG3
MSEACPIYDSSPILFLSSSLLQEHAKKAIRVDPHPHLGIPTASIHLCKHALTMKLHVGASSFVILSSHPFYLA